MEHSTITPMLTDAQKEKIKELTSGNPDFKLPVSGFLKSITGKSNIDDLTERMANDVIGTFKKLTKKK